MQALSGFQAISRFGPRRSRVALFALGALVASVAVALAFAARPAGAAPAPAAAPKICPSFRVLHNDRIGPAVFPAGNYAIALEDASLTCKSGGELFARFLEDFDGVLPTPWKVSPEASGKSSFVRGALPGFSVELTGKGGEEGGTNPDLGTLCPHTFTVNSSTVVRPLRFTKGKFLIYLPTGSGVTCEGAVSLFQRFLGSSPTLPQPWKLIAQTATFYKPANPTRSSFRIEPLAGSGRR
ncbi:MAG TPA: hypothetical protein VGI17_13050 [Solirubrobacterales bacterium]|jgi:hypothetical protein